MNANGLRKNNSRFSHPMCASPKKLEKLRHLLPAWPPELIVEAPLRICPLGAHIDHQGGVVTGMSIDRGILLAGSPSADPGIRLRSTEFSGEVVLRCDEAPGPSRGDWGDYARAGLAALQGRTSLRSGIDAVVSGDLPQMGLSSSAALLIVLIMALAQTNEVRLSRREIAHLVQEAENSGMGLSSGLLDPSIILFAEEASLTRIQPSSFSVDQLVFPGGRLPLEIIIAFSGISRRLVGSDYNSRVHECRLAAKELLRGIATDAAPRLCDVPEEVFKAQESRLPPSLRLRACHFFGELHRVEAGCRAWRNGDLQEFGRQVNLSGLSSIDKYQCGIPELITLDGLLRRAPGVLGTRFSGGGFGGSCIALIKPGTASEVINMVSRAYQHAHPGAAQDAIFEVCRPSGPARVLQGNS